MKKIKNSLLYSIISGKKPNSKTWKKNEINLLYYTKDNFGDAMVPDIVQYMLQRENLELNTKTNKKFTFLVTLGSLLQAFRFYKKIVWGTGVLGPDNPYPKKTSKFANIDARCVRGPLTEKFLLDNNLLKNKIGIYGDPGLLIPLIYPCSKEKKYDVSIIPHFRDTISTDLHIIDVRTKDWKMVVDEIVSSKLVISSSLHGIIVAEAYGIPAIWLHNDQSNQGKFKYLDYYYSTGRTNPVCANSIDEALQIKNVEVPDLKFLQENLIKSFPYDLWRTNK